MILFFHVHKNMVDLLYIYIRLLCENLFIDFNVLDRVVKGRNDVHRV